MKQETKFNEELEEIQDLLIEVRNTNTRNHENYSHLDSKLAFYFTLTTTILLLSLQFIKFSEECFLQVIIYFIIISILLLTLIFLIIAYNPTRYESLDTTKLIDKYKNQGYKNRLDLLQKLAGTISSNTDYIKKISLSKARWVFVSSWLIFSSIILIIILVLSRGVLNV